MSEGFKLEIVNPESSFLSKEGVSEVVVPAFEGDMGILKDHISIISFLKSSDCLSNISWQGIEITLDSILFCFNSS